MKLVSRITQGFALVIASLAVVLAFLAVIWGEYAQLLGGGLLLLVSYGSWRMGKFGSAWRSRRP